MSKRDTFERNIKVLTGARSLGRAIEGWDIARNISLAKTGPRMSCELCGTAFREGAVIRRPATKTRKAITVTVGGTCLDTILRGSFADRAVIGERRKQITSRIRETYGALVQDPGSWIRWIVEHVPTRLAPLAAQLRHLGMVPTDRELNRLIAFHDRHRQYPAKALLPIADPAKCPFPIPAQLTIDAARAFYMNLPRGQWAMMLAQRANQFRAKEIDKSLAVDSGWRAAWNKLSEIEQRCVIALASLSDAMHDPVSPGLTSTLAALAPLPSLIVVPVFVWANTRGLGIIEELSDEASGVAEAWFWRGDNREQVGLLSCRSIAAYSEDFALKLESIAFWERPPWYLGQGPVFKDPNRKQRRRSASKKPAPKNPTDEYEKLAGLPCIASLIELARFKGKTTLVEQLGWLRQRVRKLGQDWSDFVWWAVRYSTSPDCREKIDRITTRLCR